jgi:putative PIN family toxin of toxin-antitoxin system
MHLVFDTNVLISALLSPKSIAAKTLNWTENNGTVLYSEATLTELISVLNRPKFSEYISLKILQDWLFVLKQYGYCRNYQSN